MQRVGGFRLEPANILGLAVARDDRKARLLIGVELHGVQILLQQLLVPIERHVVEDRIVFRECHIVRQARSGQRYGNIMLQLIVRPDDAIMHIGRVL